MSSPLPIIMLMSGMPGMPSEGICIPDPPPSIDFELVEVLDDDEDMVEDEEDIMEDILEDMPPVVDIIPLEGPPNFMSPIIFFIMSSMSPPMSMPSDIMGAPPPPDVEVMVELEDEEEEKDMEDLVVPSGLWVEAAIIWEDSAESCLTEVLPSSVV